MTPAEERNLEMLRDAYVEHQLSSDWDYVLDHINDDLTEINDRVTSLRSFLTAHGWDVSYNDVTDLVKEL